MDKHVWFEIGGLGEFFIVVGEGKRKNISLSSLAMLLITQLTHETAIQTENI